MRGAGGERLVFPAARPVLHQTVLLGKVSRPEGEHLLTMLSLKPIREWKTIS